MQNSRMQYVREFEIDIDKIAQQAVDAAQDILIDSKQDTLVSGENIKTINGTSVLGSGDIEIDVEGKVDKTSFTFDESTRTLNINIE